MDKPIKDQTTTSGRAAHPQMRPVWQPLLIVQFPFGFSMSNPAIGQLPKGPITHHRE
jgi:hypothetical protein